MAGDLVKYALEHELLSFGTLVGICVSVFLIKLTITEWLSRRRPMTQSAGDRVSERSRVQHTTVGDIDSRGGDVEINPRIDSR